MQDRPDLQATIKILHGPLMDAYMAESRMVNGI